MRPKFGEIRLIDFFCYKLTRISQILYSSNLLLPLTFGFFGKYFKSWVKNSWIMNQIKFLVFLLGVICYVVRIQDFDEWNCHFQFSFFCFTQKQEAKGVLGDRFSKLFDRKNKFLGNDFFLQKEDLHLAHRLQPWWVSTTFRDGEILIFWREWHTFSSDFNIFHAKLIFSCRLRHTKSLLVT